MPNLIQHKHVVALRPNILPRENVGSYYTGAALKGTYYENNFWCLCAYSRVSDMSTNPNVVQKTWVIQI